MVKMRLKLVEMNMKSDDRFPMESLTKEEAIERELADSARSGGFISLPNQESTARIATLERLLAQMVINCKCGGTGKVTGPDFSKPSSCKDDKLGPLPSVKVSECLICREAREALKDSGYEFRT